MDDLLTLAADLPTVTLQPGEVLIEHGSTPGRLWVLVDGAIEVEHDGRAFATVDTPGALFGEMSVVLGQPATATVRARAASVLHVSDDPIAFLTERPGAALAALRTAATRLDNLTRYLSDVKRQYADREGHLGMVDDVLDVLVHHQPAPARTGSRRDADVDDELDDDTDRELGRRRDHR
jgi:CRP/FNR family cyclic AMP-dependent transcriptional regulator